MGNFIDLTGQKFGRLIVIERASARDRTKILIARYEFFLYLFKDFPPL